MWGDLGDELHRACAGADDRDTLAREWVGVIPFGGVKAVAGEAIAPLDPRQRRLMQLAGREDQRVCLEARARCGLDGPAAGLLVPGAGGDGRVRLHQGSDAVVAGDPVQVGVDLSLCRAQPRPVASLGIGVGVEVARHVAGRAGVAVEVPGTPEVRCLLEDPDRLDAVATQLDRCADPAEAGPDDDDLEVPLGDRLWVHRCGRHASPPDVPCWPQEPYALGRSPAQASGETRAVTQAAAAGIWAGSM